MKSTRKRTSIHYMITEWLKNRIKRENQQRNNKSEKKVLIGLKAMIIVKRTIVTLINSRKKLDPS
jgi:hypothetical protein